MTNGYQNQPTLLNNVETFAWVPAIVSRDEGRWFAQQGHRGAGDSAIASETSKLNEASNIYLKAKSSGMRLFSVSGDVARPGVVEVPCGITLGELIDDHCQGMLPGKQLLAVSLSGASSGFLPAKIPLISLNEQVAAQLAAQRVEALDVRSIPLDVQFARSLGIMLGGGIVVYGTGTDVLKEALACSRFFRDQSCGKCVPCRIGTQKITQMGQRLVDGAVTAEELPRLCQNMVELSDVMQATSICGLGQVAANPLRSVLAYFAERIEQSLRGPATSENNNGTASTNEQLPNSSCVTGEECKS